MLLDMMLNKLDDLNFNITEYKENDKLCGYEMETWTDNGIHMIHFIDCRDYEDGITAENVLDQLKQISVNFDVDDEVYKLMEFERARKEFSYRDAVNDFEAYENRLHDTVCNICELYDKYDPDVDNVCANKERPITLIIRLTSKDTFAVDIHDHDSGDDVTIACHDEGESVEGENKLLAAEIRSWVSLMRDGI